MQLIATSREPLAIAGETIYRVPSLSLPEAGDDGAAAISCDAVALLADRARAQGVTLALDADTIAVAVSVCRRLDGLPLAIELAAARLRSMSLGELAGRLNQGFGLLTGGSRTALARQQTLQAAIDWSYSLLSPAEQRLLGRLSVFAAGFDLAAAETVCGYGAIAAAEVAVLLGSLADKSLVVTEPAAAGLRYRLLETIRLFAAERLAGTGGQEAAAACKAHCAHYLTVAETAAPHLTGPEQGAWLARLETAADAILGLARLAADAGEWHRAATLHGAAQALVDQTGVVWDSDGAELRHESLDQVAAALGDEQLKQAYTPGTGLSFDHAIDLALGT
jgi:predicted ATPase